MFESQIKELYKYQTKKQLNDEFTIIELKRKSMMQYVTSKYKWVLVPIGSLMTSDNYETNYKVKDSTHLFFIENQNFGKIKNSNMCRELTDSDKDMFKEFIDSCSKNDRDEGMVSLEDDFVYGLFEDKKIVAVSSLWNWGDVLSDIGVLVHPEYRKRGYAKTVCQTLMSSINKSFVWRCDEINKGSYHLAIAIGFKPAGLIQELVEVK